MKVAHTHCMSMYMRGTHTRMNMCMRGTHTCCMSMCVRGEHTCCMSMCVRGVHTCCMSMSVRVCTYMLYEYEWGPEVNTVSPFFIVLCLIFPDKVFMKPGAYHLVG